jgi:hypothetical protein
MTTGAEAIATTNCADLRLKLECVNRQNDVLASRVMRLNGLILARDNEIAALTAANERLQAELDAARAGLLKLPY